MCRLVSKWLVTLDQIGLMLKDMKHGLAVVLVTALFSCSNDNLTTSIALEGNWVDIITRTDTLTFGLFGDRESLVLRRGKEVRDGFLLPKDGSGSYDYKVLTDDKISLRWDLSSNSKFNDYYFKQYGDKLTIEKFFDTTTAGTMLTFKKLD